MRFLNKRSITNIYYIPALLLFALFAVYPLITGVKLSFTDWNGYSQSYKFVGLKNYLYFIRDSRVLTAFVNTLIYGFVSTLLQNIIGLGYALLLNKQFVGRTMTRTIIYMQAMVSMLIMGYMYYFILQYDGGALNDILRILGKPPIDLLRNGTTAVLIMTGIDTIQFVGVAMVIYLAGLQNISASYYEAAQMDGARAWACFRYITLPLLTPAINAAVILNLIGGLKLFDIIMALTYGGPGFSSQSLSTLISYTYFKGQTAGYSATIGIFTFIFILIVSIVLTRVFGRREVHS
jgi:raffinose/stachyose/melibiose transport system permease protein